MQAVKILGNGVTASVSLLVNWQLVKEDFKSREGRDGVQTDNVWFFFFFFSITHEEIFFSETLEWRIVSLLSLILHGTSKVQVCLDVAHHFFADSVIDLIFFI